MILFGFTFGLMSNSVKIYFLVLGPRIVSDDLKIDDYRLLCSVISRQVQQVHKPLNKDEGASINN